MNLADIEDWQPDVIAEVSDALAARRRELQELGDDLDAQAPPSSWTGPAARAAAARHRALRLDLDLLVAEVSTVVSALDSAEQAMQEVVTDLRSTCTYAVHHDCRIDLVAGTVTPLAPEHETVRDDVVTRLEQILRCATSADVALAAALTSTTQDSGDALAALAPLVPPPGGSEQADADWWNALTPEQQERVIAEHPEWIGNTDGIPAWARDRANRSLIDDYRTELDAEYQRLLDLGVGPPVNLYFINEAAKVEKKLDGLDELERVIARPDRQLLVLDITGRHELKAAVAVGDVDTADSVGIFTGGFTTNVRDSMSGYDNQMASLTDLAASESVRTGQNRSIATVTWMGYEAPQLGPSVLLPGRSVLGRGPAEAGAADLASFMRGIDASRTEPPHLVPMGHSYGSVVTGLALQETTGADAAVIFGSPGIGTSNVGDLQIPDGQMYMVEARRDWVADTGHFGHDPTHIDGITGLSARAETIEGVSYTESVGHSDYLTPGSTSQYNLAQILAGQPGQAVYDDGRGFGDWLSWPLW